MSGNKISRILLASTALSCLPLIGMSATALAGPQDGVVSGGSATISQSGTATSIHQSSDRAIIDWRSFDVGSHESVRFYQPGTSSLTLNRIHDSKASQIDGRIEANGQIMLLNQNGIVFGAGSRVDVAGLIASTGQIDDQAFMNGSTILKLTPGTGIDAKIINHGHITARDAGLIGLVAPTVENHGIIEARLGKVTLAGAERVTLDLAGDQLISIDVTDQVDGHVKNTGLIAADGGTITLTASRASQTVETSIVNTGTLRANSVGIRNGRIILSAGGYHASKPRPVTTSPAPAVVNAGTIMATGQQAGETGGHIEILGDSIKIAEDSLIDTSGIDGGGIINIGGSYQGAVDRPTAAWVEVDHGSTTRSNGGASGDGGTIIFWADRLMTFRGFAEAEGGDESGDGGFVEVSGKNRLIYTGHVSTLAAHGKTGVLLLDPTNIEISNSPSQNVTGTSPYTPDTDDVVSIIDAATLLAALSSSSVVVQTRATGSQAGNITVNAALSWLSGNTLTLDAHNDIIVNQAINGANISLISGNDVQLNANLLGSGILTIEQKLNTTTMGIGAGSGGTLNLSTTDLSHITDGWSRIVLGKSTSTATMTVAARTWTDALELRSGTGIITISGAQTMGANNLTITTNADLAVNAALTGTGTLTISGQTTGTGLGLGTGASGTINLNNTEIANITNGWTDLVFGRTDATTTLQIAALTWNDNLTLQSGSGGMSVNGIQTMGANNLTLVSGGDINVSGNITGTGNLTVMGATAGTTIGLGNSSGGSVNLNTIELGRITNGWNQLTFGRADGSGIMNVTSATWNDNVVLRSGTGIITISGAQTMGANNLSIYTDANLSLTAALNGTGTLNIGQTSAGTSMGLGTGQIGDLNLTNAEIALIANGWSNLVFGTGGTLNVGATSWNDNVTLQSGADAISINGAQTMGANNLTINTDSDLAINALLTGSGTLSIGGLSASTITGIGTGQSGALQLSDAELSAISDGWANLVFGAGGALNVGAATWNDNVTFQSGAGIISINGTQTMGANNLTINTDSDLAIGGALTGSGILTIAGLSAGTVTGIGTGQTGALQLSNAELANITDGWSNLVFGSGGALNVGAATWNDNVTLQSGAGIISINGAQTMGANNLTINTDADLAIGAGLTGSGTLTIAGFSTGTGMGIGTGQTGALQLSNADLANITDGWTTIIMGRTDGTGAVNAGAATWNDELVLQSDTGVLTIAGAQTMGANALTLNTNSNIALNAALTGTGTLTIRQASAGTAIGLGNASAGAVNLDATELGRITNGWNNLVFGRADGTAVLTTTAVTWNDNVTLQSGSGSITIAGTQTMGANNLTINTDADLVVNATLVGTGTLTIAGQSAATTIGLGNSATGTLNLTATEIGRITNGWTDLVFGRATGTGAINLTANTWNDQLNLISDTGVISITGAQAMAGNNLLISTNADLNIGAALTSAGGTLTITGLAAGTTMGLGTGQSGTLNLTDAEIANISNGWANLIFGTGTTSGAMNVGALNWNDHLTLRSGNGIITINGAQNLNGNNLTLSSDADINVDAALTSAGGVLTIAQQNNATTMGIGSGQTGTLNLNDTEISRITDGWGYIQLGSATATGDMNVGAATWADAVTLRSATGIISVNGTQTMGANNLTITSDADVAINAALTGTGTLTIGSLSAGVSTGIGAGQTGAIHLSNTELGNITDGWNSLVFGTGGNLNIGAATWTDNVTFQSGAGIISINGVQSMGANALTIRSDADLNIGAALTGTGTLTIAGFSAGTTVGVGTGQTGLLQLSNTDLANITNGWNSIVIGRADGSGAVNVGALIWNDNLTYLTDTGILTIAGTQTMGANNLTLSTNSNIALNASLVGTGVLTVQGTSTGTTMGLGNTAVGTVNLDSTEIGRITNGWTNLVFGREDGTAALNLASTIGWNDTLTLLNRTGVISIAGTQTMNAGNSMNITTDADIALTGALTSTGGTLTISGQSAGTTMGLGASAAGTINLTATEIGLLTNGWGALNFGRADGTGAITVNALTWNDNVTLRTATGVITIAGTQTVTANTNMNIFTDVDLVLNAALTGTATGNLTIAGNTASTTIGLGNAATGTLNLTTIELGRLTNSWNNLIFGTTTGTGAINVTAATWNDHLTLQSDTGAIGITGAQALGGNNLTIKSNVDVNIGATLTSASGTLTISGQDNATTIGLGTGQAGTINLTDGEVANIANGWISLVFGSVTGTGDMNVGALSWNDQLTLRSATGQINVNGTQSLNGNNLNIITDADVNLAPGANLTSAGGNLLISQQNNATTMGIGNGQSGTLHLSDTELGQITDGWTSLVFGSANATGAMNVGAYTWNDAVMFRSAAGVININGAQNMGANALTISSNGNPVIGAALNGTGTLSLTTTATATTIGVGNSQSGSFNLTNAELDLIGSTWSRVVIGNAGGTGVMNVGAYTWNDALTLQSAAGVININGNQNMGANELAISTDGNLNLAGQLIGTGLLNIYATTSGTIGIGTGQVGTLGLTDAELNNIANGWNMIMFGRATQTGAINAGARSWNDNLTYRTNTGIITINGEQTMLDTNTLNFSTNANLALNANLTGASTLTFEGAAITTTIGVGTGQGGTLNLDNLELGRIQSGWSELVFGNNAQTGTMAVGGYTWQYNTRFVTNTGVITVSGAQSGTGKNMTFETNGNLGISGALSGTGILTIKGAAAGTAMGIGTSQAGALALVDAELALIQDGWSQIVFGRNDMTAQMNIGARTWTDSVKFTTGTGQLRVNAAQTMGANNLTLETDSDLLLSANLNGTGTLTIQGASVGTSIGVGTSQTGALSLNAADLTRIVDGWSQVQIGRNDMTGNLNIGANAWQNKMTFLTRGNIVINGNQTTTETTGTTMVFATLAGAFINNGSATSINPGTGRFLVYSVNAANDTYNGMSRPSVVTQKNYYGYSPGSVVESGNVFIYSAGSPKVIQVKIDDVSKVYGDTVPLLTWTYVGGLEGNETLAAAITASTLTASGASVSDSAGTNRAITGMFTMGSGYSVSVINGTLTVTKAPIVIQTSAATRVYGDANPTLTATYTGFKNADTFAMIDTAATVTTGATVLSDVNTYAITAAGAVDDNYVFNYNNTALLTITKANLSITADNKTREYGDANPALTVSYSGFKNGDTSAVLNTAPTIGSTATATTAAGTSAITLTGGTDNNYNLVLTNGTLTITKATLTATADNKTREYGDANPAFTATYTGFKNGETAFVGTQAAGSTTATATTGVGNHAITLSGATATNYNFVYVDGTLSITKANLTATADNKTRAYGDANPALTVSYTGFKNGETSAVLNSLATASTTAVGTTGVGNQVISVSGATADNYNITHTNGTLAITKAMLTVIADNKTREYGDANPALTFTYTGFKNGEDDTVINSAATVSTTATATTGAGNHVITASGGSDDNYDFSYTNGTLAITKATLTATADNKTRLYGDANPALTTSYTGFKNGETSIVIDTQATAATTATTTTGVGTHTITTAGAVDDNYVFVYNNGTLTIDKATVTVTADNKTREYGDANPALTVSYAGLKNGETDGVFTTGATASTTATTTTGVGNVAITAAGATDDNYDFVYSNGTLAITKAMITVTADNKTREYGDANPALTVSYAGFKNGETDSVFTTGATASTTAIATTGAGNAVITAAGATDDNYDFTYTNGTLAITKATLTATADNKTREYGDANPTLTTTYTGFKNGETDGVINTAATASTTANATSGVGNHVITTAGALDDNYDFVYANGTLAITKATITATADNKTREYGDANPALTVSYTGFKNGETDSVFTTGATASTTATATTGVGNVAITAAGATDDNYDFVYTNGTLAITKATITATADNKTREYGDANPALTVSYTGFKNGETDSVFTTGATASTTATATTGVGNVAITAAGATDDNYDFVYTNGNLTITKATISVTADNKTREYGDANPALTVSYTGFKNGENSGVFTTGATASTTAIATTGVGNVAITAAGAADDNYDFVYTNGNLAITKATISVTADNKTREYGDANPALTVSYAGFKNGETDSVVTTGATASTTATATTGVGNAVITAAGATDDNYDFVYNNGTLAITKATLTVTADNQTREYGDANPALTVSYAGFKNGETDSVINTAATASTTATATTNVGNVAITASGANDDNYAFVYTNGTLAITKATLTATADDKTRIYGNANPALTVGYTGFKNGETSSVINTAATASTTANATSGVGNHVITASGASDNNYDFVYANGTLAITKATVTVTADNKTREYGDANPGLTVSYAGFRNGETSSVLDVGATASTTAIATTGVGSHAITAAGAVADNYDFVYNNGTLSITKATLNVTANNNTRIYGDANPALTVSYSGFKNGETLSVLDTAASAITGASATSNVGSYTITAGGGIDDNYTFAYTNGSLAITKAALTATISNVTREYGLSNPSFTISYAGFKNGNTASVLDTAPNPTTTATSGSGIGNYLISAAPVTDNNYSVTFVNGNLNVTRATINVDIDDQIRLYGDPNPPLTYSLNGLRNGDTASVISGLTISTSAGPGSVLGFYTINGSGASAANYNFTYSPGSIEITGTMPPPPVIPPSTGLIPGGVSHNMATPETGTGFYDPLYNIQDRPEFLSGSVYGDYVDEGQYIAMYYYNDPLNFDLGIPLVWIDPNLYLRRQKEELGL